jgi:hypothetical protein
MTTEGESVFSTPENYTVKTVTTMAMDGREQISHMILTSKWLGADCGDVKPVAPPQ